MLDHDELLPEELANPSLTQELRITYQLTSDEQRVLVRVHERLAQYTYPLPVHEYAQEQEHPYEYEYEPVSAEYASRLMHLVPPIPVLEKPTRSRRRWLRNLSSIAGVLFLVLLVSSLVFTFTATHNSSVGSSTGGSMHLLLVPAATLNALSQQEMQEEGSILAQRFNNFGLGVNVNVQMIHGQPGLQLEIPHFMGNEQQIITILVETGILDFWNTGPSPDENAILAQGTVFDPAQYIQYNPGGQPPFTNQDLDKVSLSVGYDQQTGKPQIEGIMKGDAITRFETFTAQYINYGLTITLDGKVLSSANIQSAINGPFIITGNFTQQQASAVLAVLKYGPLPFALKQVR